MAWEDYGVQVFETAWKAFFIIKYFVGMLKFSNSKSKLFLLIRFISTFRLWGSGSTHLIFIPIISKSNMTNLLHLWNSIISTIFLLLHPHRWTENKPCVLGITVLIGTNSVFYAPRKLGSITVLLRFPPPCVRKGRRKFQYTFCEARTTFEFRDRVPTFTTILNTIYWQSTNNRYHNVHLLTIVANGCDFNDFSRFLGFVVPGVKV